MKYYERKYCDWGDDLGDKTLVEARDYIENLIKLHGEEAKLTIEYDWDTVDFRIEVVRTETEEEKAARIAKEQKQEKADRTRYEKLKAKYGWE